MCVPKLAFPDTTLIELDHAAFRFALRTLRELKLLVYWAEAGVSENV